MKVKSASRSNLLLMEILIAILFFSIASAVCLQLFVKSHTFSQDSKTLDYAVHQTGSVAELLAHTEGNAEQLKSYFPTLSEQSTSYYLYYTKALEVCSAQEEAAYYMEIQPSDSDTGLTVFQLSFKTVTADTVVYATEVTVYRQHHDRGGDRL